MNLLAYLFALMLWSILGAILQFSAERIYLRLFRRHLPLWLDLLVLVFAGPLIWLVYFVTGQDKWTKTPSLPSEPASDADLAINLFEGDARCH